LSIGDVYVCMDYSDFIRYVVYNLNSF